MNANASWPYVGMDVSKHTLDVCLTGSPRQRTQVANTVVGFEHLPGWLSDHGLQQAHICLEATGTYSDAVTTWLIAHGYRVSVLNPARLAAFRASEGISHKTDQVDAWLLARYGEQKHPPLYQPTDADVASLQMLLRRQEDLQGMRQQERNRLENTRWDEATRATIQEHIQQLQQAVEHLQERVESCIAAHSEYAGAVDLLDSVPGIGPTTAMRIVAMFLYWQPVDSVAHIVRCAGLDPTEHQSGISVHGPRSISKRGSPLLRKWLFMCVLVVLTHNADFQRWADHLRQRGKPTRVIQVAVMHKLLRILVGIWKSGQPYDPRKAFPAYYVTEQAA